MRMITIPLEIAASPGLHCIDMLHVEGIRFIRDSQLAESIPVAQLVAGLEPNYSVIFTVVPDLDADLIRLFCYITAEGGDNKSAHTRIAIAQKAAFVKIKTHLLGYLQGFVDSLKVELENFLEDDDDEHE